MNRQWEEKLEEESSCTKQREGAQPVLVDYIPH